MAVQVDPMKPKLTPPGIKRLKLMCNFFQLLLSNSTCAATTWTGESFNTANIVQAADPIAENTIVRAGPVLTPRSFRVMPRKTPFIPS